MLAVQDTVLCPICGARYSTVRGSILKHMKRSHGVTTEESKVKLGWMCQWCGLKPKRSNYEFCSPECGRLSAGSKISDKRAHESPGVTKSRLSSFYSTLEAKYARPESPETVAKYVEELGFKLLSPHRHSQIKLKLQCQSGHKVERLLRELIDWPTCQVCTRLKRAYSLRRINDKLSEYRYELIKHPEPIEHDFVGYNDVITIRCDKQHEYETYACYLLRDKQVCPKCNASQEEKQLALELDKLSVNYVTNDRKIIKPLELDFVLPERRLAIEMCGLYYHSEAVKLNSDYHRNKLELCRQAGYRLITIFADEWYTRRSVCMSRIVNAVHHDSITLYDARKLNLVSVDNRTALDFYDSNHLQGKPSSIKASWGLYSNHQLIACLSLGQLTRAHTGDSSVLELKRMANLPFTNVRGGFSRLLKHAKQWALQQQASEIRSYCDLRWGTGNVYDKLGFKLQTDGKATYWYTDAKRRFSAYSMKKTPEERLTGKTELDLRIEQGLYRIWDCGHQTWSLTLE